MLETTFISLFVCSREWTLTPLPFPTIGGHGGVEEQEVSIFRTGTSSKGVDEEKGETELLMPTNSTAGALE